MCRGLTVQAQGMLGVLDDGLASLPESARSAGLSTIPEEFRSNSVNPFKRDLWSAKEQRVFFLLSLQNRWMTEAQGSGIKIVDQCGHVCLTPFFFGLT